MNTEAFNVEVSKGVQLKVNVNPTKVFGEDFFNTLQAIEDGLNGGSLADSDLLGKLDGHFEEISAERSEIGARYNRLEMIDARIQDQEIIASRILSENEDADIERVITDLTIQESIHRASLAVGSKVIQPTLIDFLR